MRYKGLKGRAWESVRAWSRRQRKHCYTCPNRDLHGINAQAGHYQPVAVVGSNNRLAWDERFIRLQCFSCNGPGQGMQNIFRENLVREHGEKVVADFDKKVYGKFVDPIKDWVAIKNHFDSL